jgi:lysophospholipid acyltransferase (LPLAT)-like uncharacterized protein
MSLFHRITGKLGYLLRLRLSDEPGPVWRGAMALLAFLLRLLGFTLRYRMDDRAGYLDGTLDRAAIILIWHNRIVCTPQYHQRHSRRGRGAVVLTSASREGSLLAMVLRHFGIGAVRGSTSRRASTALREVSEQINAGNDVFITPDGPRGPRYRLQPGALFLAQKTKCPLLLARIEYSRCLRFKTWDGFAIPLPFARVDIVVEPPVYVSDALTDEEFEQERCRLERRMKDGLLMD